MGHNENSGKKKVHNTKYLYKEVKLGILPYTFNPNTMVTEAVESVR